MSLFKKYPEMNVTLCESKLSTFSLVTAKRPSEQKKRKKIMTQHAISKLFDLNENN